ncbi:MAG: PilN domain-containing protein [Microcoleaceae cyanobacterium]
MYSLDINFLNDRPDYKPQAEKRALTPSGAPVDRRPILIGAGVALALNALMGGAWLVFNARNANLERELAERQAQLDRRSGEVQALDKIYADAEQANEDADALATVFNEVKPWSALSLELAKLMQTAGVKITSIEEVAPTPAPPPPPPAEGQPPPPPPPPETATLSITGDANSLTQVNDFLLLLDRSPFFEESGTKLNSAALKENTAKIEVTGEGAGNNEAPELQPIVEYELDAKLTPKTASEILPELEANGASGLVNRIETLQQRGVIQ